MTYNPTPVPAFYDKSVVGEARMLDYVTLQQQASDYTTKHNVRSAVTDNFRINLVPIDMQNTFCLPPTAKVGGGQLYVGGRTGTGAVDDTARLAEFIYTNTRYITDISPTMDTHLIMQIFHPAFWVDPQGNHPDPMTVISVADVESGKWAVNPRISPSVNGGQYPRLQEYAKFYVTTLEANGKYPLIIWPYHGMLGGIGHALMATLEEAIQFHGFVRWAQPDFQIKGGNFLTENYSVGAPEVMVDQDGNAIDQKNVDFMQRLLNFDAVIIAGEAASHCVAWTISDILDEINVKDPNLAQKIYILKDCTSPVVVPGVVDYTDEANAAMARFEKAGMHLVESTTPLDQWDGIKIA
jgi:nicotinamidase-related amidase